MMPSRPLFLPLSRHHQMAPPPPSPSRLGPFDSPPPVPPPSMPPSGFRPFSNAPPYYYTPQRPSRAVISLQHLPLEYYRRYVDRTVGNLSPVAGRRGRARRIPSASQSPNPRSPGRRHTSRNPAAQSPHLRSPRRRPTSRTPASQPPNPRSPGRRRTSRTPDVQEVRQACQSRRQDERWVRDTSFVDDDSSTAEGVSSRELHKCVSRGRTHLKMVAAADDHEKGKQAQTSHRQSIRGKKETKRQTDQISISDYADSTAGDEGYIERAVHEGSFVADSRYEGIGEGGHLCHPSQGQDRPRGPCNEILEMTNAPTTGEGDFMQVESQELMPSMRNELGAPVLAASQPLASGSVGKMTPAPTKIPTSQPHGSGSQGRMIPVPKTLNKRLEQVSSIQQFAPGQAESQKRNESTMEEGEIRESSKDLTSSKKYELEASSVAEQDRQDQVIHQDHPALEKGKEEKQRDQTSNMEDASSAVGGETNRGLAKNEKMDQSTHVDQTTPWASKAQKQSEHIVISDDDDASSAAEGDVRDGKSKEFVSSTSIDPAFGGEEMQVDETHQAQASPLQTKGKRPKGQMYPFEDGSSTSGGEIREKKLQKLSSSSKVGPEASVPESLCNFLDEKSHGCHDEEVSGSLSSSLLDWASTFGEGEVSSCDLQNGGADGEMVKVGNYHVKEKYAVILRAIMKKHGDIGKDFKTSSIMWRSFALEGICEIFQGLRIPLKQLTSGTLENYNSFVKEAAGIGMNVEWLEQQLCEISETIDEIKECKVLRDAAEMKKEKFENLEKEFGLMVIQKKKMEDEIEEIKASLESGAIEIRNKRRDMNNIKVKCRNIPKRLLDGLF